MRVHTEGDKQEACVQKKWHCKVREVHHALRATKLLLGNLGRSVGVQSGISRGEAEKVKTPPPPCLPGQTQKCEFCP